MSGADAHWDAALAEGRILLQRPISGGQAIFPPRIMAPGSGDELEWFEASGDGEVYSVTWVQQKPPKPAYNVVIVELAEGARMMSRVEGVDEDALRIGMPVKARISETEDGPVIVFDAKENAHG